MNVLYITHSDDKYGAAKSLFSIVKNITEFGVQPTIVTLRNNKYNDIADEMGIKSFVVPYEHCTVNIGESRLSVLLKTIRYFLVNAAAQKKLLRIVDREKIDIIHVNTSIIDVGILVKKRRNIHLVWHIREFLDLDFNRRFIRKNQIDRMNEHCDKYIYISEAIQKHWLGKGLNDNGIVIYNGVNAGAFVDDEQIKESGIKNIAFFGSITPNKGQHQLIDAIEKMPSTYQAMIHVFFYGKGRKEYEDELKKNISNRGLDHLITFAGYTEDVGKELSKCSIGVIASKSEGFGRVTVEYMLSGLVVVASDCGANIELIDNYRTGLLYKYGDPCDLSEKLCWIIDHEEEAQSLRKAAKCVAKKKFSEEKYIYNISNLYKEIINED